MLSEFTVNAELIVTFEFNSRIKLSVKLDADAHFERVPVVPLPVTVPLVGETHSNAVAVIAPAVKT